MAVRFRPQRGKWQVYWVNPFSKKQESVQCATEQEARRTDDQIKFRLKWEPESFRRDIVEEVIPDDCVESIYALYLKEKQFPRRNLQRYLSLMSIPLAKIGRRRIGSVTRRDIAEIIQAANEAGRTQATIKHMLQMLYAVLRWAECRGFVERLPRLQALPHTEKMMLVPPTTSEIEKLLAVAPPHIQRIIILGSKMGLRVGPSEMFKLRWDDIDLDAGIVHLRAAKKNKSEPIRDIPIMRSLIETFRRWKDEDGSIPWVVSWRGKPILYPLNARTWNRMLESAGLRKFRPYDLRHAFATELIAAGADIGTVSKLMGHANVTMTLEHYQHVMTKQKEAAVERLPDVSLYVRHNVSMTEEIPIQ